MINTWQLHQQQMLQTQLSLNQKKDFLSLLRQSPCAKGLFLQELQTNSPRFAAPPRF